MAVGLAAIAPVVLEGPATAFYVSGHEMPMRKVELRKGAKTANVEGSTSLTGVPGVIWEEFGAGSHHWTFTAEGVIRTEASQLTGLIAVPPQVTTGTSVLDIVEGSTYLCHFCMRRPGWIGGAGDPGFGYWGNGIFEDVPMPTFDPTDGKIDWRCSGKGNGALNGPNAIPATPGPGSITPT